MVFKALASETRLRIILLLSKNKEAMRFSDIARELDIHKSTMEDHIRKLIDSGLISQHEGLYTSNINSEYCLTMMDVCSRVALDSYLSTHRLEIPDKQLQYEFTTLKFEVLTNILTLVERLQKELYNQPEYIRVGGALDMAIETSLLEIWQPDFKSIDSEFVFPKEVIESLKGLSADSVLIRNVSTDVTRLFYMKKPCNIGYGFTERGGVVFLPSLDNNLGFSQCLFLQGPRAVYWFNRLHRSLKEHAIEVQLKELEYT
ncbi:MAG: hypothetical protein BAJATHORv1_10563 [Candidatus Thorarchaeota archaeon]|nr:MAG: hypothetical protein BAJATHORv1_10563 [Candidatus Thorarchaeota archaeon]